MPDSEFVTPVNPGQWTGRRMLDLPTYVATGRNVFEDCFDIAESVLGQRIPQGTQFAYLFRRFGNPNRHSDPDRDLVAYLLTTSKPDMLLKIVPYADGDVPISFTFLVPHDVRFACRDWDLREIHRHNAAFMDWIEAEDRIPEWADAMAEAMDSAGWPAHPGATGWRRMMAGVQMISNHPPRKGDPEDKKAAILWYGSIRAEYETMHPTPEPSYRKADVSAWDHDDPMKPYAEAMIETLRDLLRPVWMGDAAISIQGPVDEDDDSFEDMEEAPAAMSSGHPAGLLGNIDPANFERLQRRILQLHDDPAKAIARALDIMNEIVEADFRTEVVENDASHGEDGIGREHDEP